MPIFWHKLKCMRVKVSSKKDIDEGEINDFWLTESLSAPFAFVWVGEVVGSVMCFYGKFFITNRNQKMLFHEQTSIFSEQKNELKNRRKNVDKGQ